MDSIKDSWFYNSLVLNCSGLQIREALQLQLDVQRRLHEQLEVDAYETITFISEGVMF